MANKPRLFYGYIIVAISFFIMLVILGLHASLGIFFKPMLEDLGWTSAIIAGAFSLSQVMHGVVGTLMGWLNDRFGPRLAMTICGLLSCVGYLLVSQVREVWQLYIFYGLLIGAGSGIFAPILSTVARWFVKRRSMMAGVVFAGSGVGMLIIPPVVNQMISLYDWRLSFAILGIIILIVVVVTAQFLKRDPSKVGQIAYGEKSIDVNHSKFQGNDFSLIEAVHTRQFWLLSSILVCYGFCFFSIQFHINRYVIDLGISKEVAAAILAVIGGATIVGQIGLGSVADRIGYKPAFLIGLILIVIAILTLIFSREPWMFFFFATMLGLAFGNCSTQESPMVAWLFGLKCHGIIFGFIVFSFTIGAALGPWLTGVIFDSTGSYHLAFVLFAILAVIAIILTVWLRQPASTTIPKSA